MSLAVLIDELGALEAELAPFKAKLARAEVIRKAIRAEYADAAPHAEHTAAGENYWLAVGACGNVSVIDTPALIERVGIDEYKRISTVTRKAIEENFGPAVIAAVVSTTQTGPRALTVTAIAKPQPEPEKPKAVRKRVAKPA
jgi:hypothetical protein